MFMQRFSKAVASLLWACLASVLPSNAFGQHTIYDLKYSTDPTLVAAREVDLSMVPPDQADQTKAEKLYLQFVHEHPDHPLVPYIYSHLGHMYTDWVNSDWKDKYPHVRDELKAGRFFAESVKHHPPDKISGLLDGALVCAAAGAPTRPERVRLYIEYYQWLTKVQALSDDDLAAKMWLTDSVSRQFQDPVIRQSLLKVFRQNLTVSMRVATTNMVGVAKGGRPEDALKALDKIIQELPDTPPAAAAEEAKLEVLKAQQREDFKRQEKGGFSCTKQLMLLG